MPKVQYIKPTVTYANQLEQLKNRGLQVSNDQKALHILENISYYRLSGYWYPMLDNPKANHIFKPSSSFDNAFLLYCFDRELRQFILSEIEKIEIAVRAKMIYILSLQHGPFWFSDAHLFSNAYKFQVALTKLTTETARSDEEFIKSFKKKYTDPLPPSWMTLEISSFGNLSFIYKNLKPSRGKRDIANYFKIDDKNFESWLHSFVYVRNICAHHGRLWNRKLSITPGIPTLPKAPWINITTLPHPVIGQPALRLNNTAYFLFCMTTYLLNTINPKNLCKIKFQQLLAKYPNVDVAAMGFPEGWEQEPLWL